MQEIRTLSGRSKLRYQIRDNETVIEWKKQRFSLNNGIYSRILNDFFVDSNKLYPLGASRDKAPLDGLGMFIKENCSDYQYSSRKLTTAYATAIAAIMYDLEYLERPEKYCNSIIIKKRNNLI